MADYTDQRSIEQRKEDAIGIRFPGASPDVQEQLGSGPVGAPVGEGTQYAQAPQGEEPAVFDKPQTDAEIMARIARREARQAEVPSETPEAPSDEELRAKIAAREARLRGEGPQEPSMLEQISSGVGGAAKGAADAVSHVGAMTGTSEFLKGAGAQAAKLIGVPADLLNNALAQLGVDGRQPGVSASESLVNAVHSAAKAMGYPLNPGQAESLPNRMGAETVNQVVGALVLRGAAPTVEAATAGAQAPLGRVTNEIAGSIARNPATTTATAVTSAPGMVLGGDSGKAVGESLAGGPGATGEAGKLLGELAGGIGTSGMAASLDRGVRGLGQKLAGEGSDWSIMPVRGYRGERPTPPRVEDQSIVSPVGHEKRMQSYSREMIDDRLSDVDMRMSNILTLVSDRTIPPVVRAERVKDALETLQTRSRAIEDAAWARIPRDTPVAVEHELDAAIWPMINRYQELSPNRMPSDFVTRLLNRLTGPDAIVDRLGRPSLTSGEVIDLRSNLGQLRREVIAGEAPDATMIRNIDTLDDAFLNSMASNFRGNVNYDVARNLSQELRSRLNDGPIGTLFRVDRKNAERVSAGSTMESLMRYPDSMDALNRASQPVQPVLGMSPTLRPLMRDFNAQALQVRQETEDAVKSMFQRTLDDTVAAANAREVSMLNTGKLDPGRAEKAMQIRAETLARDYAPLLRGWTNVLGDLAMSTSRLTYWMGERTRIGDSLLAQASGVAPSKLVNQILADEIHPDVAFRTLRAELERDPLRVGPNSVSASVESLKQAVIKSFLDGGGQVSPTKALERLQGQTWNGVLSSVLTPREMERLTDIVQMGKVIEAGQWNGASRKTLEAMNTLLFKFTGLALGSNIAALGSSRTGSLSFPAQMSRQGQKIAEHLWDNTPDPSGLIARAVFDPRIEQVLRAKVPQNYEDMVKFERLVRGNVVAAGTVSTNLLNGLADKNERMMRNPDPTPMSQRIFQGIKDRLRGDRLTFDPKTDMPPREQVKEEAPEPKAPGIRARSMPIQRGALP